MSTEESRQALVYTDGACIGNPGPGGYAAVTVIGNDEFVVTGGDPATTNNKMELMAPIRAVERLPEGVAAVVHSDSEYVVKGITEWLPGWKRNGWRKGNNKPVMNRDIWEHLDALAARRVIKWQWVRGHAGRALNERANRFANAEAMKATAVGRGMQGVRSWPPTSY